MSRLTKLKTTVPLRAIFAFTLALAAFACATTHEEPPAPPPPPVDPTAFSGPARSPAPEVDLTANADASNPWVDASPPAAVDVPAAPPDAGSDARPAKKQNH